MNLRPTADRLQGGLCLEVGVVGAVLFHGREPGPGATHVLKE